MSIVSTAGSTNAAWLQRTEGRGTRQNGRAEGVDFRQKLFNRIDTDGSGGADATELQAMLDKLSARAAGKGNTAPSAALAGTDGASLLNKFDANGDGSVGAGEFKAGMRALLPQGSSTLKFATGRQPPIPEPADVPDETATTATTGTTGTTGTAASAVVKQLMAAIDSYGDGKLGRREWATFEKYMSQTLTSVSPSVAGGAGTGGTVPTLPTSALADASSTKGGDTAGIGTMAAAPASDSGSLGRDALALAKLVLQRYQTGYATGAVDPVISLTPGVNATA